MQRIYYTVGPASVEQPKELLAAGADGVRLTFSFGTPEIQLERAQAVKTAGAELGKETFVIADLAGGGPRVGEIVLPNEEERFDVAAGEMVSVVHSDLVKEAALPIPDQPLYESLTEGDVLVVGDGSAMLALEHAAAGWQGTSQFTGVIEGRRGLTVQNEAFAPTCLTEKDLADLQHIVEHGEYDAVALSFVSSAVDVTKARAVLDAADSNKQLIAKIETQAGVENIDEICQVADQVMVARGDLALALPWEKMPKAVDAITAACRASKVPFIMATQVAEGMLHGAMLTRAEMTDLWHWKQSGMSGLLLSRETAWGERPVETIESVKKLLSVE